MLVSFFQAENSTDDTSEACLSIVHSRMHLWGKIPNGWVGGGKKCMRIHATGGAYLNSRLTFIYLATFNFYGRDSVDSLGPAGSSRCVVPGTPGAPGAWYNIRGRAAPLNWGVPRVAIRRTRASKTRRKSYLWSKGKRRRKEFIGLPRAEFPFGRYDRRIDGFRLN